MAVHKVPQDVEADDKFLGPLSFKQFLFFGGAIICGYLTFLTFTKVWPVSFIFLLPTIVFGFLAFPWSKEQPTELWLASRIRFLIVPRKRIWDQTGMNELVNITVPVREAHVYTDGLSQDEVHNRLGALASIVDSRGWAVKNVLQPAAVESDRLVTAPVALPDTINDSIVDSAPDVFDNSDGTIAKQFDNMIENSEKQHRSETLKLVEKARQQSINPVQEGGAPTQNQDKKLDPSKEQDFWFMHNQPVPSDPSLAVFQSSTVVNPVADSGSAPPPLTQTSSTQMTEEELLKTARKKHERDAMQTIPRHEKIIDPNGSSTEHVEESEINELLSGPTIELEKDVSTMTATPNPDILNLAKSNDLNVETLSRQANKKGLDDGEVVISLR
jgi:hypothetical protein